MNALVTLEQPSCPLPTRLSLRLASDFAKASKSAATLKAYGTDFRGAGGAD